MVKKKDYKFFYEFVERVQAHPRQVQERAQEEGKEVGLAGGGRGASASPF